MKFGTTLVVLGLIATVFAQCVITEEEALMNMYVAPRRRFLDRQHQLEHW
ncbi:Cyst wall protein, type 1A [Carpediemonas membranifera]|uniref:Cyst wall protein, type 1A n=1 Tax=Carpediemonas membranifera TaxID=201153 RepID=A0A8J6BCD9_9EUKA|nr:Cyst wall protein, type 1A [Carpediemonas membranifera]|eukprot:KAG9394482.1 Cyst wall protein, type 1A [Carpediemonas membranifera]